MASEEEIEEYTDDRVQVFLRLRPPPPDLELDEEAGILQITNHKTVSIFTADKEEPETIELDGIFEGTSPPLGAVCDNLAERFVTGRDATLVAYGPRQTGKTNTLFGNTMMRMMTRKDYKSGDHFIGDSHVESSSRAQQQIDVTTTTKTIDTQPADHDQSTHSSQDENNGTRNKLNHTLSQDDTSDTENNSGKENIDASETDEPASLQETITVATPAPNSGIAMELCHRIFQVLEDEAAEVLSLSIRVSVVEIYLDRMIDLLLPRATANQLYLKENPRGGATLIQGCAAVSCVQPMDIVHAIQRGLQQRTISQHEPLRDSHRSTVVVQIRLDQERTRQMERSSVLQIVDLCASEITDHSLLSSDANTTTNTVSSLDKQIAAGILALQQEVQQPLPFSVKAERPVLAQLLLPFCRGETVSRVVLTASTANIKACLRTLEFGQACQNLPAVRLPDPEHTRYTDEPLDNNEEAVERERRLTELVFALSHECQRMAKIAKAPRHGPIWTAITEIQKLPVQHRPLRFCVETKRDYEINAEKFAIRADLREAERKASTHKHLMKQLESDIQVLKAQNEELKRELADRTSALNRAKHLGLALEQQVQEMEHNLRTSQFRECEAVVFLRQFRKFYYRLLRQIHGEDMSPGGSIVKHIMVGAPDLVQLIDLDKSMMESGLMEEYEIGKDISLSKTYLPSQQALVRSVAAAESVNAAAATAAAEGSSELSDENSSTGNEEAILLLNGGRAISIVQRHETGEATEARQRVYKTPAGRYLEMREKAMEEELLATSEKMFTLQNELLEERAAREELESKSLTVNKAKQAKELRTLKDQLTRKSNDLKAVIFKMNEIHTVSKTLQEKVADREQHVQYLEEELAKLHAKESALLRHHKETEEILSEKMHRLEEGARSVLVPIWQLSEPGASPPPITSRISVSFGTKRQDFTSEEEPSENGQSLGEQDDWLNRLYQDKDLWSNGSGTELQEEVDVLKKELKRMKQRMKQISSQPSEVKTRAKSMSHVGASKSLLSDDDGDGDGDEEGLGSGSHDSFPADGGIGDLDDLLFMEDGDVDGSPVQANKSSAYGELVHAYKKQSQTSNGQDPDDSSSSFINLASNSGKIKEVPHNQNRKPSLQGHMHRWNANRAKTTPVDEDDQSATPEWMKKFKKIAARNIDESVIETSGEAEARELTRTSFGETLKLSYSSENRHSAPVEHGEEITKAKTTRSVVDNELEDSASSSSGLKNDVDDGTPSEQTPPVARSPTINSGKKTVEEEENFDAGHLRRMFASKAANTVPLAPDSPPKFSAKWRSSPSSPVRASVQPPRSPEKSTVEEESFNSNRLKKMFSEKAANAKPLVPTGSQFNPSYSTETKKWVPKKKKDDDSDSDDSFAKGFLADAMTTSVQPNKMTQNAKSGTSFDASDDEGTDHEAQTSTFDSYAQETVEESGVETSLPAEAVARRNPIHDDPEIEADSSNDYPGEKDSNLPDSLSSNPVSGQRTAPKKKSFLDESDTEAESEDDAPVNRAQSKLLPNAAPSHKNKSFPGGDVTMKATSSIKVQPFEPPKQKSFLEDSDSDTDDESVERITAPSSKHRQALPTKKKPVLRDSDDESDDDSVPKNSKPSAEPKHSEPSQGNQVAGVPSSIRQASRSNSDDDSEDESVDKNVKPAKKPQDIRTDLAPPAKKSFLNDSDEESDDSSREEPARIQPQDAPAKSPAPAPTAATPPLTAPTVKKKSFLEDSDSDSDESRVKGKPLSSRSAELAPATSSKTQNTLSLRNAPNKNSFLDDSESEMDSDDSDTVQKRVAASSKKSFLGEGGSEKWDDEDVERTFSRAPASKKKSSMRDSDSESEADIGSQEYGGSKSADDDHSSSEETERASIPGFEDDMDIRKTASRVIDPPIAPDSHHGVMNSAHDSVTEDNSGDPDCSEQPYTEGGSDGNEADEENMDSHLGDGETSGSDAIRCVPDFGAEVKSAVPSLPSSPSSKSKFVIKDAKLVKEEASDSKKGKKKKKPKFTIKNGKLVQDDASSHSISRKSGHSDHSASSRRHSLDSKKDDLESPKREARANSLTRRGSITAMVPAARSKPKSPGKSTNFVIKNGKLVKNEERDSNKARPQQPAFSILGGKLVKAGEVKKKRKKPKK